MIKRPKNKNEEAIKHMFIRGATFRQIGRVFSVSRQRIHQIVQSRRDPREWHEQRRRTNLELVGQYNCEPVCQRCRNFLTPRDGKKPRFCRDCGKKLTVVISVQALIRKKAEIKTVRGCDTHFNLSNAAYLIRKHSLKPVDFR